MVQFSASGCSTGVFVVFGFKSINWVRDMFRKSLLSKSLAFHLAATASVWLAVPLTASAEDDDQRASTWLEEVIVSARKT